jgi:hypothetical protein
MNIGFINTLQALIHHAFPHREGIFFQNFGLLEQPRDFLLAL